MSELEKLKNELLKIQSRINEIESRGQIEEKFNKMKSTILEGSQYESCIDWYNISEIMTELRRKNAIMCCNENLTNAGNKSIVEELINDCKKFMDKMLAKGEFLYKYEITEDGQNKEIYCYEVHCMSARWKVTYTVDLQDNSNFYDSNLKAEFIFSESIDLNDK